MTELTKEELKEIDALIHFICVEHGDEWYEYGKKNRKGKQDLEQVSMLIYSILGGYRVMIGKQELENMLVVFANMSADIKSKMDENKIDSER